MGPNLLSYRMLQRQYHGVSFLVWYSYSSELCADMHYTFMIYGRIETKERITFWKWLIREQTGIRGRKDFALNRFHD